MLFVRGTKILLEQLGPSNILCGHVVVKGTQSDLMLFGRCCCNVNNAVIRDIQSDLMLFVHGQKFPRLASFSH